MGSNGKTTDLTEVKKDKEYDTDVEGKRLITSPVFKIAEFVTINMIKLEMDKIANSDKKPEPGMLRSTSMLER